MNQILRVHPTTPSQSINTQKNTLANNELSWPYTWLPLLFNKQKLGKSEFWKKKSLDNKYLIKRFEV